MYNKHFLIMMKARFAPSPTGIMHIGNIRTALYNYLLVGKENFILRIEDTDSKRSDKKYIIQIINDLKWLGIQWKGNNVSLKEDIPYLQSERMLIYEKFYNILHEKGYLYYCYKTDDELFKLYENQKKMGLPPKYPLEWRKQNINEIEIKRKLGILPSLRLKVPENEKFVIEEQGKIHTFYSEYISDFIVKKSDGSPSFIFCNAIDDSLMNISHVIRGIDHLSNTPKQIMILEMLKLHIPKYLHIALIYNSSFQPLSKRDNNDTTIKILKDYGYFPMAIINYIARLGHDYNNNYLMSYNELSKHFSLNKLNKSSILYNEKHLKYWQKKVILNTTETKLYNWMKSEIEDIVPYNKQLYFVSIIKNNILFPQDAAIWAKLFFNDQCMHNKNDIFQLCIYLNISKYELLQLIFIIIDILNKHLYVSKDLITDIKEKCSIITNMKNTYTIIRFILINRYSGPTIQDTINLLDIKNCLLKFNKIIELMGE
jgi:glutamyl-tRNA synthetase